MKPNSYKTIRNSDDASEVEFISNGPKGSVLKRIIFCETFEKNVYELAFGDVTVTNRLDYNAITDNDDRDKVLVTVALAIELFLSNYPNRVVSFSGVTQARTRLYQMAISINLSEIETRYEVEGKYGNEWMPFHKNLKANAFRIKKRT